MKTFRIFKGKTSEAVAADRVEAKKLPAGLTCKFFIGKKMSDKRDGVVILMEETPEIKIEVPKNENQDDD